MPTAIGPSFGSTSLEEPFTLIFGAESLLGQTTGVGRYSWDIFRRMRNSPSIRDIRAFANLRWIDIDRIDTNNDTPAPAVQQPIWKSLLKSTPGYLVARSAVNSVQFRNRTARLAPPLIYHEPNFVVRPFDGPTVATIHDLGWIHYPDFVAPATRRWLEKGVPKTLREASRLITPSKFVAQELVDILGVSKSRIRITPLGVDTSFHPRPPIALQQTLAPLGLEPGRYLLSVATLEPRKNLSQLLRAFSILPIKLRRSCPLILVGSIGWQNHALKEELQQHQSSGCVRWLGYLDDHVLPILYAGALAIAVPAIYEGFGLPIIEAMASGVPVLTSNRSAMAEVAGDAALLVDPHDEQAIAIGIEQLISDAQLREHLAARGVGRAKCFTWQRTAELTLAAYREAMSA